MSQSSNTVYKSFVAGQNFDESHRYHFVKLGTGPQEVVLAGATDTAIGVLTDFVRGHKGMPITVAIAGTSKVSAGGSVTKGAWVGPGANGVGAAKTEGNVRGLALEAAEVAGEIIEVLLVGPQVVPTAG